jgi:hypothetical protein
MWSDFYGSVSKYKNIPPTDSRIGYGTKPSEFIIFEKNT